jgi:AcrR family transcriptional regulator
MAAVSESPTRPRRRRTQQERSDATREALLDATLASLSEVGYAKTTTAEVCDRAGLSRGAHTHHFGTRPALISAAIAHLGDRLGGAVEEAVRALPEGSDAAARLDALWAIGCSDLLRSAVDMWAAARTDPELMAQMLPTERALTERIIAACRELFREQHDRPDFEPMIDYLTSVIRGLALVDIVQPFDHHEHRWAYARARLLDVLNPPA